MRSIVLFFYESLFVDKDVKVCINADVNTDTETA